VRPVTTEKTIDIRSALLPLLGIGTVLLFWTFLSRHVAPDLPSPWRTWQESRQYVTNPFFKDGEMNQGIGRLAFYSLVRVAKGFALALAIGTPIGFLLGLSRRFHQSFDPIVQFMRRFFANRPAESNGAAPDPPTSDKFLLRQIRPLWLPYRTGLQSTRFHLDNEMWGPGHWTRL